MAWILFRRSLQTALDQGGELGVGRIAMDEEDAFRENDYYSDTKISYNGLYRSLYCIDFFKAACLLRYESVGVSVL